jgi:hypothetical protein
VHDDLEVLALRGDVELPGLFARPLSRYALARALAGRAAASVAAARVREELAPELYDLGDRRRQPHRPWIHLEDETARLSVAAFARFQAEASPKRGFVLTDSTRFGLRFRLDLLPGLHFYEELYLANIEGGRRFADPIAAGTDIVIFQDRTYVALHTRYADFAFGRDRMHWAPGKQGSLLLSGTMRPFTHLRFESTFLNDRFHAVIVNGVLSAAERRYVAFHRLDWQVHRRFRVGLAEGARYQADSVEPLYLVGIIPYPLVQRLLQRDNASPQESDDAVRNNVMWAVDASWRPRDDLHAYGELLVDDLGTSASQVPTRIGYQLGAQHLSRVARRELWLRFEWTRVWRYVYSVFYGADFVHQGVPLGYPLGPDCRHFMLTADWQVDPRWSIGGAVERQDRGENRIGDFWDPDDPAQRDVDASEFQGVVERQWRFLGRLGVRPNRHAWAWLELGYARATNAAHQAGIDADGLTGRVILALQR